MKPKINIPKPKLNIKERLAPKSELGKKKQILLSVLVIIGCLAAAGYLGYMKFQEHTKTLIVEQAMKSKYHKHFDVLGFQEIDEENFIAYLGVGEMEGAVVKAFIGDSGTNTQDNYVGVRLCHEALSDVNEKIKPGESLFIHVDNALEYTDAGTHEADTVTRAEYLEEHPEDKFDVSILVNSSLVDPSTLRNKLGTLAYSLDIERGEFNVYSVPGETFTSLVEEIKHYDSMKGDAVKKALKDAGGSILTLSFEEINPPKEKAKEQKKEKESEKDSSKEAENAKDKDSNKN